MKGLLTSVVFIVCFLSLTGQSGVIKGAVTDATNNETIPFANVFIEQIKSGVASVLTEIIRLRILNQEYTTLHILLLVIMQIFC